MEAKAMLPELKHDAIGDVLYVRFPGTKIRASAPIEGDDFLILNRDVENRIVGLQLLCASEMTSRRWREYFHTGEFPDAIFSAVDSWLAKQRHPGR